MANDKTASDDMPRDILLVAIEGAMRDVQEIKNFVDGYLKYFCDDKPLRELIDEELEGLKQELMDANDGCLTKRHDPGAVAAELAELAAPKPEKKKETEGKEEEAKSTDIFFNGVKLPSMAEFRPEKWGRNDMGRAELFAKYHQAVAFHVSQAGCYYVYEGGIFVPDIGGCKMFELYRIFLKNLNEYAKTLPKGDDGKNSFQESLSVWKKKTTIDKVLGLSKLIIYMDANKLDQRHDIIVCDNCVYDLKIDAPRPHSPEYLATKKANFIYNPEAKSELFEKMVHEIMDSDLERLAYIQKAFGAGIDGTSRLKKAFIFYGPSTNNGKSTVMEVVSNVLGDYAAVLSFGSLMERRSGNASGPSPDIARMAGVRMAIVHEPNKSVVVDAASFKQFTSNDVIVARFLHKEFFEFRPVFVPYIDCNHLPIITDMSLFLSGRINVIPFTRTFLPEEQDNQLAEKLKSEEAKSAIFNWLLEGWRKLKSEGMEPPESVKDAVAEYAKESDKIGRFIDDCLTKEVGHNESTAKVFDAFKHWCIENKQESGGSPTFWRDMRNRGYRVEGSVRVDGKVTSGVLDVRLNY